MHYSIKELGKLAGVTTRTLRYYDEIGLLLPSYISESGYRMYKEKEVDLLQQILFYKALGLELKEIKKLLSNPSFNKKKALLKHLEKLKEKEKQISALIQTVEKTIKQEEGEIKMSDAEKFEGLKKDLIKENEEKYGKEIRDKYGNEEVDKSNAKMMNLTEEEYNAMNKISEKLISKLKYALENKCSPSSDIGKEIFKLHKEWLSYTWSDKMYSGEAHKNLANMYISDKRFTSYYDDAAGDGATSFLKESIVIFS